MLWPLACAFTKTCFCISSKLISQCFRQILRPFAAMICFQRPRLAYPENTARSSNETHWPYVPFRVFNTKWIFQKSWRSMIIPPRGPTKCFMCSRLLQYGKCSNGSFNNPFAIIPAGMCYISHHQCSNFICCFPDSFIIPITTVSRGTHK